MSRRQETSELTKEQQEELKELQKQMIDEAKKVRNDFKNNPSEDSGSVVVVHENSPYLVEKEERLVEFDSKIVKIKVE